MLIINLANLKVIWSAERLGGGICPPSPPPPSRVPAGVPTRPRGEYGAGPRSRVLVLYARVEGLTCMVSPSWEPKSGTWEMAWGERKEWGKAQRSLARTGSDELENSLGVPIPAPPPCCKLFGRVEEAFPCCSFSVGRCLLCWQPNQEPDGLNWKAKPSLQQLRLAQPYPSCRQPPQPGCHHQLPHGHKSHRFWSPRAHGRDVT